jgi:putative ABC transport system permease protein
MLLKEPAFTAISVITLALGIGANTTIFSVINSVLLRPLPYPNADRIVVLSEDDKTGQNAPFSIALPDYLDWRHDSTAFENLALTRRESINLSDIPGRMPEQIPVSMVTANFFKVVGLSPELGRTFTEEEDRAGGPFLAVISHRMWQRIYQGDPGVIGRGVNLQNRPATIIGIMPPEMDAPSQPDIWLPLMRRADNDAWKNRAIHPMLFGWAKLKPGVTLQQARAEMKAITARLEQAYPDTNKDVTALVTPLLESLVGKYRANLALLLTAVALVLLIACANLANLFAARGAARSREFAIRAAVGASRKQIIRQLLIESLTIAALGGALGFFLALWGRDLLGLLAPRDVARFQAIDFDTRVLVFTFALTSITSVLFGLWPAWQASRADIQLALKSGAHGSSETKTTRRTRDLLVIGDVAVTLVLLSCAGSVLKNFARLQTLALGFEPRNLTTVRLDLPWRVYSDPTKVTSFANAVLAKVAALPGVEKVGISANPPLLAGWQIGFVREGAPIPPPSEQPNAESEVIGGDYLGALDATLLRGRSLNERDTKNSPLVVMIDQSLAEKYFPGQDPIGKRLTSDPDGNGNEYRWFEIVGVVAPVKFHGAEPTPPLPVIYFPLAQMHRVTLVLLVRARQNAGILQKPIREIVASVDNQQPVYDVRGMSDRVAQTWATQRLLTLLLSVFAGLALLLATIGLYGVLSYNAIRRVREIALRLALGATPQQIRGLIFGHGARLLLIGCALGLLGAFASAVALSPVLSHVSAASPLVYFAVAAILTFATAVACWFPAQRATRVDPIVTLRSE